MNQIGSGSSGRSILCVDDEVTGLSIRKMILESQGYRVFTAETGPAALALFSSETIDLVVLDYLLPGVKGDRVAEQIKRLRPTVPVLMLSAYVDLPGETLAFVDKLVTKGEQPAVLLDAIVDLLSKSQNTSAKSIA